MPTPYLRILVLSVLLLCSHAFAEIRAEKVHVADAKKTEAYIKDGMFTGGDRAIEGVLVKDIRRAVNAGYERVVIDLEGTLNGESAAIARAPYYQIAVSPEERRIVLSIWGKPRLGFNARKVIAAFKKSPVVRSVELFPKLEEDSWTFVFETKGEAPIEVFELSKPARIIMDIQTRPGTGSPLGT
ncbi:hypothetical protein WDW86_09830 [Bdellovibrionota bacterium FG-2]